MKAKRLTALALAALMAVSSAGVSFAGDSVRLNKNDYDLVFDNNPGYYKYDDDEGTLVKVPYDAFKPGDSVYIPLREDTANKLSRNETYRAFIDALDGEDWVKDIGIIYRRGNLETTTTYDYTATLNGQTITGSGLTSKDVNAVRNAFKSSTQANAWKEQYIKDHFETAEGYKGTDGKFYSSAEEAAKASEINLQETTVYSFMGESSPKKSDILQTFGLSEISDAGYVYNNTYDSRSAIQILEGLASEKSEEPEKVYVKIADQDNGYGVVDEDGYDSSTDIAKEVCWVKINNVSYWYDPDKIDAAESLLTNTAAFGIRKSTSADGYYVNVAKSVEGLTLGQLVQIDTSTEKTWNGKDSAKEALEASGITLENYDVAKGDSQKNGVKIYTDDEKQAAAATALDNAINALSEGNGITFTAKTTTDRRLSYWVKIDTKKSDTTKEHEVYGDVYVSTKNSLRTAKNDDEASKLTVDFILTNASTGYGDEEDPSYYEDVDSDAYIEPGQRAVLSFADDADDVVIEFGDDAWYEFNARGQGRVNFAYNTNFDRDFAYDYDHANIDFINFVAEPTTNKTGTLYIYADEDSYIYEVTSKGAKKINGAYYDDDEGAWVIRTRHLTSYAISDRRLKTIDQMEDDKNSSSSSKPSGSQGSGSGNGNYKPIPDTGR